MNCDVSVMKFGLGGEADEGGREWLSECKWVDCSLFPRFLLLSPGSRCGKYLTKFDLSLCTTAITLDYEIAWLTMARVFVWAISCSLSSRNF